MPIEYGPDVAETLVQNGYDLKDIDAVIWRYVQFVRLQTDADVWASHPHLDHVGNTSTFPPTTSLVVGPGTQVRSNTHASERI